MKYRLRFHCGCDIIIDDPSGDETFKSCGIHKTPDELKEGGPAV
jgi:hypothetical protein